MTLETDEFTCVCPATGQPDFATIRVEYVPDEKIVESKSFKLYIWSYRDEGVFHEHVVNQILDDLVELLDPHWCRVSGLFNIRGGIGITVEAEHTCISHLKLLPKDSSICRLSTSGLSNNTISSHELSAASSTSTS